MMESSETVTLYHGSKSGICNYPKAKIYTLSVDLSNLKIFNIEIGLEWALLIAYNRGKLELIKGIKIYNQFTGLSKSYDMIIGYIANDRIFVVLDRFFNGEITDKALISSLSALQLGKQYAALTEKACKNIKILNEQELSENDRNKLKQESEVNRSKGIAIADEICKKYRREGQFFDKIVKVKAGIIYNKEVMYWIGYIYRYWHYYTNEDSREIYKIADAKTMNECWLGFHTLDVEMAIDDLKDIYKQKCNINNKADCK